MTNDELIFRALGSIEAKLDSLHDNLQGHAIQASEYSEKTDSRLTTLEQAKWKLAGAMAAFVFAAELFWRLQG